MSSRFTPDKISVVPHFLPQLAEISPRPFRSFNNRLESFYLPTSLQLLPTPCPGSNQFVHFTTLWRYQNHSWMFAFMRFFNTKYFLQMTHSSPFLLRMPTKINAYSKTSVIQNFGMVYCFLKFFSSLSSFKTIWKQIMRTSICFPKYSSPEIDILEQCRW